MLGLIYNFFLGALSIYGAVLFCGWVTSRRWHLVVKIIVLLVIASVAVSGVGLIVGGTPDDLRVLTELFASFGAIVVATNLLRRNDRNAWLRYGVPIALLIFMAITWIEQIRVINYGGPGSVIVPLSGNATSPPANSQQTVNPNCSDTGLSVYQRQQLGCP